MKQKIARGLALKLKQLANGESLNFGLFQGNAKAILQKLLSDGVLSSQTSGRRKKIYCLDSQRLKDYLKTHFGLLDLEIYISQFEQKPSHRHEVLQASSNEKQVSGIKPFRGFLAKSINEISATLRKKPLQLNSLTGTALFVQDWEGLEIPPNCQIVIVENFENFAYLESQVSLFGENPKLFVFRFYDKHQSISQWLGSIPNPILYFGDWDFGGIKIFVSEFYSKFPNRCRFFIPENLKKLLSENGNRERYLAQIPIIKSETFETIPQMKELAILLDDYQKVLPQEVMI